MIRRSLLVIIFIMTDLVAFSVPSAQAAGSVSVAAWNCGDAAVEVTDGAEVFTEQCPTEVANSTFALTADGVTRRRATAIGKPASWPAVAGAFTVKIDNPFDLSSAVFCKRDGGSAESVVVKDDQISGDLGDSSSFACNWYLFATAKTEPTVQPTASPTATPRVQPTKAPTKAPDVQPTATPRQAAPTATPRQAQPTATPKGGATEKATEEVTEEATEESTELPDPPTIIYPPALYRGNAARTGEQVGPGPVGDPLLLWRFPIGDRPVSSPVLAGDMIYVGGDNGLFAVDARTGTQRWYFATEHTVESSPSVVDGLVYFGGKDGYLYCLDAQTGVERWRFETAGMIITSPLVDEGFVYFVSYDGNVYSVDAFTGEEEWRFLIEGTEFVSSPTVFDGLIVVGSGDLDGGFLYGIEAESGALEWRHQVAGSIGSTPAIVDGIAYFGSDDGWAYALNIDTVKREWRLPTEKLIRSSPGIFDGVAYFGNRLGNLYAFDVIAGEQRWFIEAGDWVDSSPSFADGKVYFGSKKRRLFVVEPADGSIIWEYQMGASITTSPLVVDGVVYFAARDGFLYAIGGSESADNSGLDFVGAVRPADVPIELVVNEERYLFDRMVELDPEDLDFIGSVGELRLYSSDDDFGAGAIYANHPVHDEEAETVDTDLVRYLPALVGTEGAECLAEAPRSAAIISDGESTFGFAGAEPDLSVDSLVEVASSPDLGSVYAETADPPFKTLYVVSDDVLQRYVILNGDGVPANLLGLTTFNGQIYSFADDITEETDEADLSRIGCTGPFTLFVETGAEAPYSRIIVSIAGNLLQFDEEEMAEPIGGVPGSQVAVTGSNIAVRFDRFA